jgi:hypothetical protein
MSHVPVQPAILSVLLSEPLPLNLVNTQLHLPDGDPSTCWTPASTAPSG